MGTIEHTPGPWQAKAQAIGGYIIAREGVSVVGHSIAGVRQSKAANEAQCEANAHLISAAPCMFTAGKPLADLVERFTGPDDAMISVTAGELRALRSALQKATPQENPQS